MTAVTSTPVQPPTLRTNFVDGSGQLMLTSLQFLQQMWGAINLLNRPPASITPTNDGDLVIQATSNTTLTFKYKGSDGTIRSGAITLS